MLPVGTEACHKCNRPENVCMLIPFLSHSSGANRKHSLRPISEPCKSKLTIDRPSCCGSIILCNCSTSASTPQSTIQEQDVVCTSSDPCNLMFPHPTQAHSSSSSSSSSVSLRAAARKHSNPLPGMHTPKLCPWHSLRTLAAATATHPPHYIPLMARCQLLGKGSSRHIVHWISTCLLYTSPSPRDRTRSRMPSSA